MAMSISTVSKNNTNNDSKYLSLLRNMEKGEIIEAMNNVKITTPVNVVAITYTGVKVDLFKLIRESGATMSYKPQNFAGATLRYIIDNGRKVTCQMFNTGSLGCMGYSSVAIARLAAIHFRQTIERTGKKTWSSGYAIVNEVRRANFGYNIDLWKLFRRLDGASYDPDQFTGLAYPIPATLLGLKGEERFIVVLVFLTGSLVVMGPRSEFEFKAVMKHMEEPLNECKIDPDKEELLSEKESAEEGVVDVTESEGGERGVITRKRKRKTATTKKGNSEPTTKNKIKRSNPIKELLKSNAVSNHSDILKTLAEKGLVNPKVVASLPDNNDNEATLV